MNIPETATIKLSQAQRFVEGLKILAEECGLTNVNYNGFGPRRFDFDDGSSIMAVRAFMNAEYINEDHFKREYHIT